MNIQVNVINQKLKIATNIKALVAGTQEFIRFEFIFDEGWDDLKVFAQFRQNGSPYNVFLDDNNSVYLPPEILPGNCEMSICGTHDTVIAYSDTLLLTIDENRMIQDANSTEITESLYNQLVEMVTRVNDGVTFIPSVSEDGVLSWTNEGGYENPAPVQVVGSSGVGIESIEQTTFSDEDGGENVLTITLTDGRTSTFTVKNGGAGSGSSGSDGEGGGEVHISVDDTLSIEGAAADAHAVGQKINELSQAITSFSLIATDDGAGNVTISIASNV